MIDDPRKGLQADASAADDFMAILVTGQGILGIVQMDRLQLVQSDDAIEFRKDPIQIVHDIIASIVNVTGIETNSDFIF